MKYLKVLWPYLLLLCCVLSFAGCGKTRSDVTEDSSDVSATDLSAFLTAQQVRDATGFAVGEPIRYADGGVGFYSADGQSSVYVDRQEMSAEQFDALLASFADNDMTLIDAPELGERARWCEEALELVVYARGYALDVQVTYGTSRPNDSLLAARQLAALLLETW